MRHLTVTGIATADFIAATQDGVSWIRTRYVYQGQSIHLLNCFSPFARLDATLGTLKSLATGLEAGHDLVIDCYLGDAPQEADEDDMARRFAALVEGAGFGLPIRRIVMVMSSSATMP